MNDRQTQLLEPPAKLTSRQQLALDYITAHQPVTPGELGALLHADRAARGGRGHPATGRCDYCADEGRAMGAALRRKGLVKQRRKDPAGWVLPTFVPAVSQTPDTGLQTDVIPF